MKSHTVHLVIQQKWIGKDGSVNNIVHGVNSYTENTIEISCHGSTYVQQEIIDLFVEKAIGL